MTDGINETAPTQIIGIVDNKLLYGGMVLGTVTHEEQSLDDGYKLEPTITLNLGWMKMAGVHIVVLDDPEVDHHRDGKVLER